jgi:hypothetical protein
VGPQHPRDTGGGPRGHGGLTLEDFPTLHSSGK